jgi:glucose/mannose transport system substrate-binding protein
VKNPDEVAGQDLFVQVLLDPVVQAQFAQIKGAVPARLDADRSGLSACDQMVAKTLETAVPVADAVLPTASYAKYEDLLTKFWADPAMTADAAAAALADAMPKK